MKCVSDARMIAALRMPSAAMRNWSLLIDCAGQAPMPHAGVVPGAIAVCVGDSFHSLREAVTRCRWDRSKCITAKPLRGFDAECEFGIGPRTELLAKPKPGDCRAVPLHVLAGQVRQQAAALPNEFEKSPSGVEVVFVCTQVIRQTVDSLGEESNLNLGRTGIFSMCAKLGNDRLFLFALQRHTCRFPSGKTRWQTQKNRALLSTQSNQYSI